MLECAHTRTRIRKKRDKTFRRRCCLRVLSASSKSLPTKEAFCIPEAKVDYDILGSERRRAWAEYVADEQSQPFPEPMTPEEAFDTGWEMACNVIAAALRAVDRIGAKATLDRTSN